MIQNAPRLRKCSAVHPNGMRCRNKFIPRNSGHVVCSPECAVIKGEADKAKKARKELKAAKENAKTRREWLSEAQAAFNAFIRARDKDMPCISCGAHGPHAVGAWIVGGGWDAGHYLSVAMRPELRFHEDNVHKQCKKCNGGAGRNSAKRHQVDVSYRVGLIARIGLERVEWLEGQHEPAKYTIPELQEIKLKYSAMARTLISQKH